MADQFSGRFVDFLTFEVINFPTSHVKDLVRLDISDIPPGAGKNSPVHIALTSVAETAPIADRTPQLMRRDMTDRNPGRLSAATMPFYPEVPLTQIKAAADGWPQALASCRNVSCRRCRTKRD